MKLGYFGLPQAIKTVTPFVGVWIEIHSQIAMDFMDLVTPFVGVWIEIGAIGQGISVFAVTPFVGVWIEIEVGSNGTHQEFCHSLCGSVD